MKNDLSNECEASVEEELETDSKLDHRGANDIEELPEQGRQSFKSKNTKKWMYKNAVGLGFAFLIVFSAFQGLQNLQSVLHSEGGLGLASLSILYLFFTLSCFITPGIIQALGTKYAILGGFVCHLIYTTANFYPSWYTLVPASVVIGLGSGPLWAASSSHIVKVAVISASALNLDLSLLISNLVGIFFSIFRMSQIPGNLASSLIFFPYSSNGTSDYDDENNSTSENLCTKKDDRILDKKYLYILVSVYFVMISFGIFIHLTLVSHLQLENEEGLSMKQKLKLYFLNPSLDILKAMKDYKMILLVPLSITIGIEQSFLFGTFTQIVVGGCFGAYLVGFSVMVLGVVGALSSITYGKLVKWIPRFSLFLFGGSINVGVLIFLIIWRLSPSYLVVFLFVILWSLADAVWLTMTSSLVGILFSGQSDLAYSVQKVWQSIGLAMGFILAQFLSLQGRCYVTLAAVVMALVSNLILEFKTQPREMLLPWFMRPAKIQYSVVSEVQQKDSDDDKL